MSNPPAKPPVEQTAKFGWLPGQSTQENAPKDETKQNSEWNPDFVSGCLD